MNIGIADDDLELLDDFTSFFSKRSYISKVYAFDTLSSLLAFMEEKPTIIDYLFLDIHFATEEAIQFIPKIKKLTNYTEVIMFTGDEDPEKILRSFSSGASGFLPKILNYKELEVHLKTCLQGGAAITPQIARHLVQAFRPKKRQGALQKLTEREQQVLQLVANGYSNREIGEALGTGEDNIKYHVKKIYKKMQISNRTELSKLFFLGDQTS